MRRLLWAMLILGACLPGWAAATMLVQEDFDYTPGTLLTDTGNWAAHSAGGTNPIAVTSSGLSYPGYLGGMSGNAASMTTSGEDDHTTEAFSIDAGSVYCAFLGNFSAAQAAGGYFLHFYQSSSLFYGRVWCELVSGSLNFGVTRGSGTPNYSPTPFDLNTTHLIVVKYTFVDGTLNDTADLWVDPVIGSTEPAPLVSATDTGSTDATSIIGVALRQGSASSSPTQWVDGIRVGTSWSEVMTGIAVGACCAPDGSCTLTEQTACPYVWHGEFTTCDPNPCPQPVGACCAEDGTCMLTTQADCAAPSVWHGEFTVCDPNPCPQPQGACCAQDGTCTFVTEAECSGTWLGLGSSCDPNPCLVQIGACCAPDGSCFIAPEAQCPAPNVWHPESTTCSPNPCPQPDGACCHSDGTCTLEPEASCTGNWLGYGTVCDPNPCPPPSGACCAPSGACTEVPQTDCAGSWLGAGTTCNPNPCPQPGACCLPDGTCQVIFQADCLAQGGTFIGEGISCTPYPCPPMQVTICQIRQDNADGVPLLLGRLVEFEGIALVHTGTWSPTIQEFQLTDGDCCLDVFGGSLTPAVQIGDLVHVIGTVSQYNGKTEVSTPGLSFTIVSSGHPIPDPTYITTNELAVNGEQYESCLFGIRCVRVVGGTWPPQGQDSNITIDDGSGPVTMRIDKDTDVDGSPAPTGPFTVIGIGDQFDTSPPYFESYQIKPRSLEDLVFDCMGACCLHTGECRFLTPAGCDSIGGSYNGGGTSCDPNPCAQPLGACCAPDGTCTLQEEAQCQEPNVWMGMDTVCDPNPCLQPSGACCRPDGSCFVVIQAGCVSPNVWMGPDTVCDPNPCPQPIAACCHPDGTCTLTTQADCPDQWMGYGTTCTPNPCIQPVGACCYTDGTCYLLTATECQPPAIWLGPDTVCDPNPCAQPYGACCAPNGTCTLTTPPNCLPPNTYLGIGTVCDPNPCPQPLGACCAPDGTCTMLAQADCLPPNSWQGVGTVCDPNPCPIVPEGACCLSTGECLFTTEADCGEHQGIYQGNDAPCEPNPCIVVPTEKTTWGRIKNRYH